MIQKHKYPCINKGDEDIFAMNVDEEVDFKSLPLEERLIHRVTVSRIVYTFSRVVVMEGASTSL